MVADGIEAQRDIPKAKPKFPVKGTFTTPPEDQPRCLTSSQSAKSKVIEKPALMKRKTPEDGTFIDLAGQGLAKRTRTSAVTPGPPPGASLTQAFLDFLKMGTSDRHQDPAQLAKIGQELATLMPRLPTLLDDAKLSIAFSRVLSAWIKYQRSIHDVREQFLSSAHSFGQSGLDLIRQKVLHSRLLTQLRQVLDAYVAAGDGVVHNDAVICISISRMLESDEESDTLHEEMGLA
ncbi:hypothetical protein EK21DRAFT_92611 [Setomelanomma holmii]|uniref:Uncharacterized protein n=1 Tax=Setomelanomma holmii TaxID=210430 RepID=A0A9P4H228_9PLEO|nr:hypothetical protein EK21DRAFT_92611 [Setomelanomma holmii]